MTKKLKRIPLPCLTVEEAKCYYQSLPKSTDDEDEDMAIEALQDRYKGYEYTFQTKPED